MLSRLLIHVEGETEEAFANSTLAEHLYGFGYESVRARLLGNARNRAKRGGIRDWHVVRADIKRHLIQDQGALATTMVDYYALPNSWPGRTNTDVADVLQKTVFMHDALRDDFENSTGIVGRFEPYVLMHEFEALLFSDCKTFAESIGFSSEIDALQAIRDQFQSPEHINDSPITAPSKRIGQVIKGYRKPLFGNVAASEIGLQRIRGACVSFDDWLTRLENWF